eukprot:366201-Chlamydomonas_euryale.AAC.4
MHAGRVTRASRMGAGRVTRASWMDTHSRRQLVDIVHGVVVPGVELCMYTLVGTSIVCGGVRGRGRCPARRLFVCMCVRVRVYGLRTNRQRILAWELVDSALTSKSGQAGRMSGLRRTTPVVERCGENGEKGCRVEAVAPPCYTKSTCVYTSHITHNE